MHNYFRCALLSAMLVIPMLMVAQDRDSTIQFYRIPGELGLGTFETPKQNEVPFDGVHVRVGGDFSVILQGISQDNDLVGDTLVDLATNFSLPTANLNLDVQLADGMRMHLRTYLSSRHHPEAWVKGGYLQIDKLDFLGEGFLEGLMDVLTIKVGMDEINYGDAHFRRSDNAGSIYNPFVGNYIMDAFTTEPFLEFTGQSNGFLGVIGITNGKLNQAPTEGDGGISFYAKAGYDTKVNDDLRIRLTGSLYHSSDKSTRDYLYNGDRAGARYYNVMEGVNQGGSDFLPRFNPGFSYQTAFQINPYIEFGGLEFFGIFEVASNGDSDQGGDFTQLGAELIYRFGGSNQFYGGGRYNSVNGNSSDNSGDLEISRLNLGGGWYMTKNVLAKLEYVSGSYDGDGYDGTRFQGAEFNGINIEAVVSF